MSKQVKKREINKYRIEVEKLKNNITLKNKTITNMLKEQNRINTIHKENLNYLSNFINSLTNKIEKIERENEQLRAENYSLKHRGIFKKIQNLLGA